MPSDRFIMPTLPKTMALPPDGIHFGMPFETYLAAPAVGSGGIKEVLIDELRFWTRSWMNPHPPEKPEKDHQLYGHAFHCRLLEGSDVFESLYYAEPEKTDYEDLIETDGDLRKAIAEFEEKPVTGNKPERVAQLLELWPEANIWDNIIAQAERDAHGRQALKADWVRKFELSASMAENDPEILPYLANGHSEVSLFWHCPVTGIPKKARVDRLQLAGMVDVKSLANSQERPLEDAVAKEIADRRYPFQPSHYLEGGQVVRALVRESDGACIFQPVETFDPELVKWTVQWAQHAEPDTWTWIFVQKGDAPGVIGWEYEVEGMIRDQYDVFCAEASEKIVALAKQFGGQPWIEKRGVVRESNNKIPAYVMRL